MWGPRAPNTIIGLLLPPTVLSVSSVVKQSKNGALFRKKCLSGIVWIFVTNLSEVMSYNDCDQYQFGFKKGHSTTLCAGIVKQSTDYYISRGNFGVARCRNFLVLMWGPIFVGAPVRPNMLNMPKSASVTKVIVTKRSDICWLVCLGAALNGLTRENQKRNRK